PEAPYAPRSLKALSQPSWGKNPSSDATHETDRRGYRILPKLLPNEVLSSLRNAPVTNRRFLKASRSSTNLPMVTVSSVCSFADGVTPPASEFVPAVRVWTLASTPWLRTW